MRVSRLTMTGGPVMARAPIETRKHKHKVPIFFLTSDAKLAILPVVKGLSLVELLSVTYLANGIKYITRPNSLP